MKAELISHARLLDKVLYGPKTGVFTRKVSSGNVCRGSVVGRRDAKGYLRVWLDGRDYKLHRLAWFYVYEKWPTEQIDHVNGIVSDNRISNLREANTKANCLNQNRARSNNKLCTHGVHTIKKTGRYRAVLCGKHLGCFATPEEASACYQKAKQAALQEAFS